jgi:membrane protease YdiL (CAAX protease family)
LLLIDSVCVSYVTLYLIRRRGEPWSTLGLVRFGLTDPFVGLALYLLPWAFLPVVLRIVPEELDFQGQFFANPRHSWERVAVVAQYSLSAFAEELVFRAYLITRLKTLLGSTSKAIMVAAGVFALCHVYQGASAVAWTLGMGLVFGTYFAFARRLWPLVIGHALLDIYVAFQ